MRIWRPISALAVVLGLGGCVITSPFDGPGMAELEKPGGPVILSVTLAVMNDDDAARDTFMEHVSKVGKDMKEQPGLIGSSRRVELFGNRAWTQSAWVDEESLQAFLAGDVHREAIRAALPGLSEAKTIRLVVPRDQAPLDWEEAAKRVASEGRDYYQ